jgi:hypothetical protein
VAEVTLQELTIIFLDNEDVKIIGSQLALGVDSGESAATSALGK